MTAALLTRDDVEKEAWFGGQKERVLALFDRIEAEIGPLEVVVFNIGANVRFAARAENLHRPDPPWGNPRIVYLQHASDPIAWWTPDLLFAEPDWLREPRGYDVSGDMNWIPVVTFLQVAADMAVAVDVPDGHGHRYVKDVVNAWAAVLSPPGWTAWKTERLRAMVTQDYAQ